MGQFDSLARLIKGIQLTHFVFSVCTYRSSLRDVQNIKIILLCSLKTLLIKQLTGGLRPSGSRGPRGEGAESPMANIS